METINKRKIQINYLSAIPGALIMILILLRLTTIQSELGSADAGYYIFVETFMAYLLLMEAGIIAVMSAKFYRPMALQHYQEFNRIYSAGRTIYNYISIFVILVGIALYSFMPQLIKNFNDISMSNFEKFAVYLLVLLKVSIGLRIVPERAVFTANQDDYIVNIVDGFIYNIIMVIEILSVIYFKNIIPGLFIGVIIKILEMIWIESVMRKRFKWINPQMTNKDFSILKSTKDSLTIKLFETIFLTVDTLVISSQLGSASLTQFTVNNVVFERSYESGMTAYKPPLSTIGKVVNTATNKEKQKAFNYYQIMVYFVASLIVVIGLSLSAPVVQLMAGENQILNVLIFLIGINVFGRLVTFPSYATLDLAQRLTEKRKYFIPEITLNVVLSVILVNSGLGLAGVIAATIISSLAFNWWYIPKVLAEKVLHIPVRKIYMDMAKVGSVTLAISIIATQVIRPMYSNTTLFDILSFGVIIGIVTFAILVIVFYFMFKEFRVLLKGQIKRISEFGKRL
jgi:hypothetical protein